MCVLPRIDRVGDFAGRTNRISLERPFVENEPFRFLRTRRDHYRAGWSNVRSAGMTGTGVVSCSSSRSTESGEWKKSERARQKLFRMVLRPVSLFTDRNAKPRMIEDMGTGNTQNNDNCYKHDHDDTYRGTRASINFSEYTHVFDEPPKNHCIFRVDVYVALRCTRNCVILYLGCIRWIVPLIFQPYNLFRTHVAFSNSWTWNFMKTYWK